VKVTEYLAASPNFVAGGYEKVLDKTLVLNGQSYTLQETVKYPNQGRTYFYTCGNTALAIDQDICDVEDSGKVFDYSLITDKQNQYMKRYAHFFRFVYEDRNSIGNFLKRALQTSAGDTSAGSDVDFQYHTADRSEGADASPLEFRFEKDFAGVYGPESIKFLQKEYGISDGAGKSYFLDYLLFTKTGKIAVEENGVTYHHPQLIRLDKYRRQLRKQNVCALWGIKLFRFSSEDCQFEDRIEDDIREIFGTSTDNFLMENGLKARRPIKLYDHQKLTLEEIEKERANGHHTFLIFLPTASGKSMIVEQDMKRYAAKPEHSAGFHALIMAPTTNIISDWQDRIHSFMPELENKIEIRSYSYMARNYADYQQDTFSYIVVDEAHHAVAPVLQRVIQYFTPDFLVGMTATDERMDHKKLEDVFGTYTTKLSLKDAMQKGIVADARVFRIKTNLDLSRVRYNGHDYVNADLESKIRVTSRNDLIADVLAKYFGRDEDGQGIIFCVNIRHAAEMEKILLKRGISAKAYTGGHSAGGGHHAAQIMADFKAHKIRFLCACNMISEGWDYPELRILVMARPTLSKVLYLQQVGRGLRRTDSKKSVYIIDVVDEYGAMVKPCSMHAIFENPFYVPFGDILRQDYKPGEMVEVNGLVERVESIEPVDIETFESRYAGYLNQEQLAREFFVSTGSITSWITKRKITPTVMIPFGSRKLYLFSPEDVKKIREENHIEEHNDQTIHKDFFDFLNERDYSLSYKMPFLLSFMKHMDSVGDAKIDDVLDDYIAFYQDRIDRHLPVDRKSCPYTAETLKDRTFVKRNMLTNPFEKFERKRFLYYSKDLNVISMNHALFASLTDEDRDKICAQMRDDLKDYYSKI